MRFIPTRVHGVLDYLMGIVLIAMPWLFGFAQNGAETWVPVILGLGMITASLMTAYEWGVVNVISMKTHLGLDVAVGIILAASPWLFGFYGLVGVPHLILGVAEVGGGLMTQTTPTSIPEPGGARRETGAR